KEKIKKKCCTPDLLEDIAKETFSRRLALTFIEEKGQNDIEEAERNTIKQEPELKRKEVIKKEEEEKQYTINKILKEAQGVEGMKNKNTKKVRQEDRLEPEDEKVYFMIWDIPNRIFKKQVTEMIKKFGQPREIRVLHSMNNKTRAEVEWSPMREDIKRKLKANWVLPLRNSQLARITAGRSKRIELEMRRQIYMSIRNLPRFMKKVLLLRQLRGVNAKVVHIFQNKNRNPRSQVVIEFENKEDRERALEEN
ncbi:42947_t:CDS:2, partial [Gigaspora margarita]